MDAKGPTAKPEEVEDYLRNLGAKDWGASLDVAVLPRKRKAPRRSARAAATTEPEPAPPLPKRESKPSPKPKPRRRPSRRSASQAGDAPRAGRADPLLGHEIDEKGRPQESRGAEKGRRDAAGRDARQEGRRPVGITPHGHVHRDRSGRAHHHPGRRRRKRRAKASAGCWSKPPSNGAEARLQMVEVTSNDRRAAAHAFYRHMGYERTSIRFLKKL
jgi:hypothetical protein